MDLQSECDQLINSFGKENIRIEYFDDLDEVKFDKPDFLDNLSKCFSKVQVTHIPSGKVCKGLKYETQLENIIYALNRIKKESKEH